MPRIRPASRCLVALALVAGCGQVEDREATSVAGDLPVVTFQAANMAFSGPDTIAAGPTRIRLEAPNGGLEHLSVVRLGSGHTLAEFQAAVAVHYPPHWAQFSGGPNAPGLGRPAEAIVDLTPGDYAAVSMVLGADGVARVRKGMIRAFTVVDSGLPTRPPESGTAIQLFDYGFQVAGPLIPGAQVVQVENRSPQRHEVILVRLAPGRTAQEMGEYLLALAAGTAQGPPPGDLEGGVAPLSQFQTNLWSVVLSVGRYAVLCLVADDGDGRSHLHHGHLQEFDVVPPDDLARQAAPDSAR